MDLIETKIKTTCPFNDTTPFTPTMQNAYMTLEIIVAVASVLGNGLILLLFFNEKSKRRTHYYIASLALADFLLGLLGIPLAILTSFGIPDNMFYTCLFNISVLIVLCAVSIFSLIAVSIDRYWAILYPFAYVQNVGMKTTYGIISTSWLAGILIGFLPLLGWHSNTSHDTKCYFVQVINYDYLVFFYISMIIVPSCLLIFFYGRIFYVIVQMVRRTESLDPSSNRCDLNNENSRVHFTSRSEQRREIKAAKNLSIIVFFFMVCWFPINTNNTLQRFYPGCTINMIWLNFSIILSHINSAVNPILYAYHLEGFKRSFKNLISRQGPSNTASIQNSFTVNTSNSV